MKYTVKIVGTQPILLHKYVVNSIKTAKARTVKLQDSSNFSEEWKAGTYLNDNGFVVMPSLNIKACLFEGGKAVKIGKKSAARTVNSELVVNPFEPLMKVGGKTITLEDIENNDWLNVAGAVISGRRVDRIRTQLPAGWTIEFDLLTKSNAFNEDDLRLILENAGQSGLGDWRPSAPKKPGVFGVFEVEELTSEG